MYLRYLYARSLSQYRILVYPAIRRRYKKSLTRYFYFIVKSPHATLHAYHTRTPCRTLVKRPSVDDGSFYAVASCGSSCMHGDDANEWQKFEPERSPYSGAVSNTFSKCFADFIDILFIKNIERK